MADATQDTRLGRLLLRTRFAAVDTLRLTRRKRPVIGLMNRTKLYATLWWAMRVYLLVFAGFIAAFGAMRWALRRDPPATALLAGRAPTLPQMTHRKPPRRALMRRRR